MNPLAEVALIVAVFASAIALAYIMHWWGELHPVIEVVADPAEAPQDDPSGPAPFATVIVGAPAFYEPHGGGGDSDGEQEDY
jgi:hypothetical protein